MTNGFVLATDPMLPPHGLKGAVYAIGNFDGLHLGHQAVIGAPIAVAKARVGPKRLIDLRAASRRFLYRAPGRVSIDAFPRESCDLRGTWADGSRSYSF